MKGNRLAGGTKSNRSKLGRDVAQREIEIRVGELTKTHPAYKGNEERRSRETGDFTGSCEGPLGRVILYEKGNEI